MRRGLGRWARALAMTLAPLGAWQGCALIAGLEEPVPVPPTGGTGGGQGGAGGDGAGNSGGGGAGGGGTVNCEAPGMHLGVVAEGQKSPRAIAVDGTRVYWTTEGPDPGDSGVWKVEKAGGPPVRVADTTHRKPISLLVDSTHAYWSDTSSLACPNRDGIARISHADATDPTSVEQLDTFCGQASMIALDTATVYFARSGTGYVQSVPKAGGNVGTLLAPPDTAPFGIAVDESRAYWTEQTGEQVVRASKDGNTKENLSPSSPSPRWIGLDATTVYWTTNAVVLKHDKLILGGAATELHTGLADIVALAVDSSGDALYVIDRATGDLVRVSKTEGVAAMAIIDSGDELGGVAVDETFVYWTHPAMGQVLRACK